MPKLTKSIPKYRKHRASDQAVVTIWGVDHYLGPFGTKVSRDEYDRLIAEWLTAGRPTRPPASVAGEISITVVALIARYWEFVARHYVKNGQPTSEQASIRCALRPLKRLYGETDANDFGPKKLEAVRNNLIRSGMLRRTINQNIGRIRRMFRWAESQELVVG
jgi:hypothetical protein